MEQARTGVAGAVQGDSLAEAADSGGSEAWVAYAMGAIPGGVSYKGTVDLLETKAGSANQKVACLTATLSLFPDLALGAAEAGQSIPKGRLVAHALVEKSGPGSVLGAGYINAGGAVVDLLDGAAGSQAHCQAG